MPRPATSLLDTDVLILGGGMAAAWAALAAAEAGARVVVADKGYMGTSGVTATGGPNHWWVPPDKALRDEALDRQRAKTLGLADPEWMARILDLTWRHLPTLARFYPFGSDGAGGTYYQGVRGSEYMRALRAATLAAGVTVLDHHPAIELLATGDGRIGGARGHALRGREDWEIHARAIILATGGNAFRSARVLEDQWRQIAALTAGARWTIAAARARRESRGLHLRADFTAPDAAFAARLLVGGLDMVRVRPETAELEPA